MTDAARAERLDAVTEAKRASSWRLRCASSPATGYARHIYAAVLRESLARLKAATEAAAAQADQASDRFTAAGLAFFDFYERNPRDLDMGFYLFAGGVAPRGLSDHEANIELNAALLATLEPVRSAAEELFDAEEATRLTAEAFAHAAGLLLLRHTHRLNLFALDARPLMARYRD
jgi:hypothetical protein